MNINITYDNKTAIFYLSGKLDTTTATKLQEVLLIQFEKSNLIKLDFSKIIYISSAGLRVLLMGEKAANERGSKQILINVCPDVMEVFEMTGFSNVLNFE